MSAGLVEFTTKALKVASIETTPVYLSNVHSRAVTFKSLILLKQLSLKSYLRRANLPIEASPTKPEAFVIAIVAIARVIMF